MIVFVPLEDNFLLWFAGCVLLVQIVFAVAMEWMIRRLGRMITNVTLCDKRCEQDGCQLLASTSDPDPPPKTRPEPWTRWEA